MTRRTLGTALTLPAAAPAHAFGLDALQPPPHLYTCIPTGGGAVWHGEYTSTGTDGFDGTRSRGLRHGNGYFVERNPLLRPRGHLVRRQLHDIRPDLQANILLDSVTGRLVSTSRPAAQRTFSRCRAI